MSRNLIIFSYHFPPSSGGVARLCNEIAIGMSSYFESVTVVTRSKMGSQIPYNDKKVTVISLSSKRFVCEIQALRFFSKLKNKKKYDVICGLWHPEALLVMLAGFKNVFILGHGTEFLDGSSKFRRHFWLSFYAKNILKKAKLVIANSNYTKQLILNLNHKINATCLPLGVNESFFQPIKTNVLNNEMIKVATLSRIVQFKGYDFIAKAIATLPQEKKKRIQWNIGGTGPYLEDLKKLVLQLGIQEQVCFNGFIPDKKLPDFYNANDIFVLCTRAQENTNEVEGFGLVFLEAQSCGIPVIGTLSGGISDAVQNGNGGWLIEQDNITELQNVLIDILVNRELLITQSLKARKRIVEECTWAIYNSKLNKLLTT